MPRRVDLPGAAELFRTTEKRAAKVPMTRTGVLASGLQPEVAPPSGRVRHEEKITVYVSSEELLALEQVRLVIRARHGVVADRGRIVRAAIAAAIAEVNELGADSTLVRRLSED